MSKHFSLVTFLMIMIILILLWSTNTMADNNSNDGSLFFGNNGLLSALLDRLNRRLTNNYESTNNGNKNKNVNNNNNDDDDGEFIRTNYVDSFFRRYGILSVFMNDNKNSKFQTIPTATTRRPRNFIYRSRSNRPRTSFQDPFLAEEVEFVPKFSNL
ncbi:uncharacterized protein LOC124491126 [Dermatophagoides farinae]|nr:putative uncharacterized protein DDB_G0286751 [Dermatophagoides farinae]XP_046909698.1 putative uncharacterized protein DDB_G0286751 [Dermatophagoides farinae]